jgi:hypothetical protein
MTRVWERFWFTGIPPASYALLRLVFGALGLVHLLGLTPVSVFWPIDAIAPLPGGGVGLRALLQASGLGTAAGWAFFAGLFLAFSAMAAGYHSRLAVFAALAGSIAQKSWNSYPLTSGHEVLIVVLFYLLWTDCGAVLSVDAWRARRRAEAGSRGGDALPPGGAEAGAPATHAIWPLRLLRFHVALIYFNSGLWKLFGELWRDGTAVHYAVSHNIFRRFPFVVPPEAEWMLTLGTYVTLAWELAFPLLILHRWTRPVALIVGILVHLGIWSTIEVGAFSWLMIASYIAFLDPSATARRVSKWSTGRSPVLAESSAVKFLPR